MPSGDEKVVTDSIREIAWRFGAQGLEGQCCGGLTPAEVRAIRIALSQRHCAMQSLADRLNVTKSGATRVVDRLEKRGLVQRAKSPDDGRVCCVAVTDAGRRFIDDVNRETEHQVAAILEEMEPNMRAVVQAALGAFVAAMRTKR